MVLEEVVAVWQPLCLWEHVGFEAPCLPPIIHKDTHLPSSQDDRAEWLLGIMITVHRGGEGGAAGEIEGEVERTKGGVRRARKGAR